jgi:hypothetical protein
VDGFARKPWLSEVIACFATWKGMLSESSRAVGLCLRAAFKKHASLASLNHGRLLITGKLLILHCG